MDNKTTKAGILTVGSGENDSIFTGTLNKEYEVEYIIDDIIVDIEPEPECIIYETHDPCDGGFFFEKKPRRSGQKKNKWRNK